MTEVFIQVLVFVFLSQGSHVVQAGLEPYVAQRMTPNSSQIMGLQVYTTVPNYHFNVQYSISSHISMDICIDIVYIIGSILYILLNEKYAYAIKPYFRSAVS